MPLFDTFAEGVYMLMVKNILYCQSFIYLQSKEPDGKTASGVSKHWDMKTKPVAAFAKENSVTCRHTAGCQSIPYQIHQKASWITNHPLTRLMYSVFIYISRYGIFCAAQFYTALFHVTLLHIVAESGFLYCTTEVWACDAATQQRQQTFLNKVWHTSYVW